MFRRPDALACGVVLRAVVAALAATVSAAVGPHATAAEAGFPAARIKAIHAAKGDEPGGRDLAAYLERITGRAIPVVVAAEPPAADAILVGPFGRTDAADLPGDSFIVDPDPPRGLLHIYGTTPRGTRQAVFDFLEHDAGCRWWSWNEEDVPQNPDLALPAARRVVKAAFLQTDIRNGEAYEEKTGFASKIKSKSTDVQTRSHAMHAQLSAHGKQHPDIYPFSKKLGKRQRNEIHHCYTAPGLAEALAAAMEADLKTWPDFEHTVYMSCMGDTYGGYCECERCLAVYEEEAWTRPDGRVAPGYSGTLLRLINATADILAAKHPGIRVGTSAYMTLQAPPGRTKPRDNVHIRIPHLRHCIIHGVDECRKNNRYFEDLRRWLELAPGRVYIWDYTVNFGENFCSPTPTTKSIARNIGLYHDLGCAGMTLQGNYVSMGSDLAVLKNHVYRRLLWDPTLDVDAVIAEFCTGYYGPAAEPMLRYVNLLEDHPRKHLDLHADEFAEPPQIRASYLPPELRTELDAAMAAAVQASAGRPPFDRRVLEAGASLEIGRLAGKRPFVLGDRGLSKVFPTGPEYTYDRAVEALSHARNASFREWAGPLKYHGHFLAAQGGPTVEIVSGRAKAVFAPAVGMRIWQVFYEGRPVFHVPEAADAPGFPLVGGVSEAASPGVVHGAFEPAPSGSGATAAGFHTSNTSEMVRTVKTVAAGKPGSFVITLASQTTKRKPNFDSATGQAQMEFVIDRKAPPRLLVDSGSGFKPVALDALPPRNPKQKPGRLPKPVEIPLGERVVAVKIGLPAAGCWVEDRIAGAPGRAGPATASYQPQTGVLTTRLTIPRTPLEPQVSTPWLERTISFSELAR
jgi:hypothetical protein